MDKARTRGMDMRAKPSPWANPKTTTSLDLPSNLIVTTWSGSTAWETPKPTIKARANASPPSRPTAAVYSWGNKGFDHSK